MKEEKRKNEKKGTDTAIPVLCCGLNSYLRDHNTVVSQDGSCKLYSYMYITVYMQ